MLRPASAVRAHDALAPLAFEAGNGDVAATRALLSALSPRVLGVARRILGASDPDVDDAAQESLVAIVRALGAFRGESSVSQYATRIAVLTCLRVRRARSSREEHRESRRREAAIELELAHDLTSEPARAARRRDAMRTLLETLPQEQAETLAMRVVLGMSLEEVAEATGAPVNTVRSRVRLAKQALQERIASDPTWAELVEVE